MKFRIVIMVVSSFVLLNCGNKTKTEQKDLKDTTTLSKNNPGDTSHVKNESVNVYEPKVVDSADINTDTEILNEKGQLDPNSSPIAVVQTIIKAAKTGNYTPLLKLSNPAIDMDGDAKDIISVPTKSKEDQKEFNDFFGKAKIVGKPRIKKNLAEVDIETTAEGGEKETIICENKFDKWYLKGL